MAKSLKRNPLNVAVCFVLWSFRGGDAAPAVDGGWGRLPTRWPGHPTRLLMRRGTLAAMAGRRS